MKKIISLLFSIITPIFLFAEPHGRWLDQYAPDLGLPEGNTVWIGLAIAVLAIPIGWFITKSTDSSGDINPFGCVGMTLFYGGIICLIPLLFWICAIMSAVLRVLFILVAILVVIGLIYSFLSKK